MFNLLTLMVVGVSTICFYSTAADLAVIFEVAVTDGAYNITMNRDMMKLFHGCLCDNDKYRCYVEIENDFGTTFSAYSFTAFGGGLWRSHSYQCLVYFNSDVVPESIDCTRQTEDTEVSDNLSLYSSCRTFNLNFYSSNSDLCSLNCVDVHWESSQDIVVTGIGYEELSCGLCDAKMPTTTTTSTASITLSTVDGRARDNGDSDGNTGNNVPVLAGVIAAVVIAVVAAIVIVVLWRKRRQHRLKSRTSEIPKHYINAATNVEEYSTSTSHAHRNKSSNPTALRYEHVKRADNHGESLSTYYGYSSVDLPVSVECPSPVHATNKGTKEQSDYIEMEKKESSDPRVHTKEESRYTKMKNQSSDDPHIYAKLHEEVRDMQNTYDVLPSPKQDPN